MRRNLVRAKDGEEGDYWSFRLAKKNFQQLNPDGYTVEIRKGQALINTKLPEIYTADEWDKIRKFNYKISGRIHNGKFHHG